MVREKRNHVVAVVVRYLWCLCFAFTKFSFLDGLMKKMSEVLGLIGTIDSDDEKNDKGESSDDEIKVMHLNLSINTIYRPSGTCDERFKHAYAVI